jgi:hypothetical protein
MSNKPAYVTQNGGEGKGGRLGGSVADSGQDASAKAAANDKYFAFSIFTAFKQ